MKTKTHNTKMDIHLVPHTGIIFTLVIYTFKIFFHSMFAHLNLQYTFTD